MSIGKYAFLGFVFVASILITLPSHAAFYGGLTGPGTSTTGDYSITWDYEFGRVVVLQESAGGSAYIDVGGGSGITPSATLTGRTSGTYQYRLKVTSCSSRVEVPCTVGDLSEVISVVVNVSTGGGGSSGGIVTAPSLQSATAVGSTPYLLDVDKQGDANIIVPVPLIAGVAGFQPSIGVVYDSGRGVERTEQSLPEDVIGFGWRLAGLSEIRRCVVGKSASTTIALNSNDNLCLDGMQLIKESGTHLAAGAKYRPTIESYTSVEIKSNTGGIWFEVTSPDGSVLEYGNSTGSRVDKDGGVDYAWSISKSTDVYGNEIIYNWYLDTSNGVNRPISISYSDVVVDFEYQAHSNPSSMYIGSVQQTQTAFLHTIRVSVATKKAREYRLISQAGDSFRLRKIQHCGFDQAGSNMTCLSPLEFSWLSTATVPATLYVVNNITDSLGANHVVDYSTVTSASTAEAFSERPYGSSTVPANTTMNSGAGNYRHVVTRLRRDNGLGGYFGTEYRYQDKGVKSTYHRGFHGFHAIRIRDEQTNVYTYIQYRHDFPYMGQVAEVRQLNSAYPSNTKTYSRAVIDYNYTLHSRNNVSTYSPYAQESVSFIYEDGSLLGYEKVRLDRSLLSGFVSSEINTVTRGTTYSAAGSPTIWGDKVPQTVGGVAHTSKTTKVYNNRTTNGKWLIGFASSVTNELWNGSDTANKIVRNTSITPESTSLMPDVVTSFPGDAKLNLSQNYDYTATGLLSDVTVSGANVASRTTSLGNFVDGKYPGWIDNALDHKTTLSSYDKRFGVASNVIDPNGQSSGAAFDNFGRKVSTSANAGNTSSSGSISYDSCLNVSCSSVNGVQPAYREQHVFAGAPTRREYFDKLGRVIRSETEAFAGGGQYHKTDSWYDNYGRLSRVSLPYISGSPKYTIYAYDVHGRPTTISRPDTSSITILRSAAGNEVNINVTETVKKANGALASNQQKLDKYNFLGQLIQTTDAYTTAEAVSVSYSYYPDFNLKTATVNGGSDGSTTTQYTYNAAGWMLTQDDPNSGLTTVEYTALGEIDWIKDNKNQYKYYHFDILGRLTQLNSVDGVSNWNWDTAAHGIGKLAQRSNGDFIETYAYNSGSLIESITTQIKLFNSTNFVSYTTSHYYDSNGRLQNTVHPSGITDLREYNARGYFHKLSKSDGTPLKTYTSANEFGQYTSSTYGNGVVSTLGFDPNTGRLTAIDTVKGSTKIQDNDYKWQSNGILESRTSYAVSGQNTTRNEQFVYDNLNRLTDSNTYINGALNRQQDFSYDLLGNIESKISSTAGDTDVTGYNYGQNGAGPHAVTSAYVNGVLNTLSYDANGAITKYDIANTSDDKYIEYNAFNLPKKIVVGSSLTDSTPESKDEFKYGPNGERILKKSTALVNGTYVEETTYYLGATTHTIRINGYFQIENVKKTFLGEDVVFVNSYEGFYSNVTNLQFFEYAHRDHLGSIESVTDQSGNTLIHKAFEAFGERKNQSWSGNLALSAITSEMNGNLKSRRMSIGFTGHEQLDRTGFIHMKGRVYDPVLGRFLSPDPFVLDPIDTQSWNRYSYVRNSPLSVIDPTGFYEEPWKKPEVCWSVHGCDGIDATDGTDGNDISGIEQEIQEVTVYGNNEKTTVDGEFVFTFRPNGVSLSSSQVPDWFYWQVADGGWELWVNVAVLALRGANLSISNDAKSGRSTLNSANDFAAGIADAISWGHGREVYEALDFDWSEVDEHSGSFFAGQVASAGAGTVGSIRAAYVGTFTGLSKMTLTNAQIYKASMWRYNIKRSPIGKAFYSAKERAELAMKHPDFYLQKYDYNYKALQKGLGNFRGSWNWLMLAPPGVGGYYAMFGG